MESKRQKIVVLGDGGWGTALALILFENDQSSGAPSASTGEGARAAKSRMKELLEKRD